MDKLEKKLRSNILENTALQIKNAVRWNLPVETYEVTFNRVKRSQMDILMKMMLLTFEAADIRRPANLSELLLVEELFVSDLLKKMERMGLVRREKDGYKLTKKGQDQLNTGVFEEELEEETTILTYSPVHDEFWEEITDEVKNKLPLFRYKINPENIPLERFLQALIEKENVIEEDGFQTVVHQVKDFEQLTTEHVPCLEFTLYNKEQDIFFARVWNTFLGQWDEILEGLIEEKERLAWRKKWLGEDDGE